MELLQLYVFSELSTKEKNDIDNQYKNCGYFSFKTISKVYLSINFTPDSGYSFRFKKLFPTFDLSIFF